MSSRGLSATRLALLTLSSFVLPALSLADDVWPPTRLPGWGRYWDSRRIVTVAAYRSEHEKLDSMAVLDDRGYPQQADSVRRLLERELRKRTGDPVEYLQVALDSSARHFASRQ